MTQSDWLKLPNLVSLLRGCLGLILAVLGIYGAFFLLRGLSIPELPLIWFQVGIVVGVLSDKLDGVLARQFHWETKLGKLLERNMDGFFIFSSLVFETVYLGFPIFLLFYATILLVTGALIILVTRLIYKKWFVDDYVSTKVAVGFAYLLIILHAANLSFIIWFDYFAILVGVFALVDFLWRRHRWLHPQHTKNSA